VHQETKVVATAAVIGRKRTTTTRRRFRIDSYAHCEEAHPLSGASSQQGLLDPIKPAHDRHRPDGRLS